MRLGDYKYPTDYRAHKQWGHDTLWTILNAAFIWSRLDAVIWNRPQRLFGSERDSRWSHAKFLFHASVAYSTLCSVAYTRECCDSTQSVHADIIMTSVAFCWRPLHPGLCGFHYDSMVSISPSFNSGAGRETGFNLGWTLTHVHLWNSSVRDSNLRRAGPETPTLSGMKRLT